LRQFNAKDQGQGQQHCNKYYITTSKNTCYIHECCKFCSVSGTHELSVEFGGQLISGSPLITEIVDPSKILLEGMKRGKVEQPMVIDGMLSLICT